MPVSWRPAAAGGLSVSTTPDSWVLTWLDNSTNEAGFRLEWSTDASTWNSAGTVGPGVVNAEVDDGPPANQTVFWRVIAYNAAGDGPASNVASGYLAAEDEG